MLLLVLGLAGVVGGYHFARVPAGARAGQVQEQADAATAQAEQISAQAQAVADQVEELMGKVGASAAEAQAAAERGKVSALDPSVGTDLQRVRDNLRVLGSLSRLFGLDCRLVQNVESPELYLHVSFLIRPSGPRENRWPAPLTRYVGFCLGGILTGPANLRTSMIFRFRIAFPRKRP